MQGLQQDWKVYPGGSTLFSNEDYRYAMYEVSTPHGYCIVYTQWSDTPRANYTRWDFIWNGRVYTLSRRRFYTQRGATTVANRFVKKITSQQRKAG